MDKLQKNSKIRMGIYSGMTVYECINQYGRKSLWEILKYYDLDEEIQKEYSIRPATPEEKLEWEKKKLKKQTKEQTNLSIPEKVTYETSTTLDVNEDDKVEEEYEVYYLDHPVSYYPEDYDVFYGQEHNMKKNKNIYNFNN